MLSKGGAYGTESNLQAAVRLGICCHSSSYRVMPLGAGRESEAVVLAQPLTAVAKYVHYNVCPSVVGFGTTKGD